MKKLARWFFALMYKKEINQLYVILDAESKDINRHNKKIGVIIVLSYLDLMKKCQ